MGDLTERHEVRVRGQGSTIVLLDESGDGRLVIRQERDGEDAKEVCAITLSNPEELQTFFQGLRRILASLERPTEAPLRAPSGAARPPLPTGAADTDRETLVAQARQRNPQAFAPWTPDEEQEVRRRYERGEAFPSIARSRKRSPRAIELRLQRMGAMPPNT